MNRAKLPYVFLALSVVLAVSALILLILKPGVPDAPLEPEEQDEVVIEGSDVPLSPIPEDLPDGAGAMEDPEKVLLELGEGELEAVPAELVMRIAQSLEDGDFGLSARLIGKDAFDETTLRRLREITAAGPIQLRRPNPVREVGELETNRVARWAIEFDGPDAGKNRIFLDLERAGGRWSVKGLEIPASGEVGEAAGKADSLSVADSFLQSILKQDFEYARAHVDPDTVSDARIAGLCIMFEEGDYRFRAERPLRALFVRDQLAGYLANLEDPTGQHSAQFGLTMRRMDDGWVVSEINFDSLLDDYAARVVGGDIYYTPFVLNPQGGETLALYFDFDDDQVHPRMQRQLEIVAAVLRTDPDKKITLSGHTDALGSDDYNDSLSARRASIVREFLAMKGVDPRQIVTLAKGASQPRRPNVTETGEDDPLGRRVNRRTEIYLDF